MASPLGLGSWGFGSQPAAPAAQAPAIAPDAPDLSAVQLAVRLRPPRGPVPADSAARITVLPAGQGVRIPPRTFALDHALAPSATQEEVYRRAHPLVSAFVQGHDAALVVCGPSASGKSFTLGMVDPSQSDSPADASDLAAGILPRAVKQIVSLDGDIALHASFLRIEGDDVRDLLSGPEASSDEPHKAAISSVNNLMAYVSLGLDALRSDSSHTAHVLFTLFLSLSGRESKLHFLDMASPESTAQDQEVLNALLRNPSAAGESKLTHLLLGNSGPLHTLLIACIDPSEASLAESERMLLSLVEPSTASDPETVSALQMQMALLRDQHAQALAEQGKAQARHHAAEQEIARLRAALNHSRDGEEMEELDPTASGSFSPSTIGHRRRSQRASWTPAIRSRRGSTASAYDSDEDSVAPRSRRSSFASAQSSRSRSNSVVRARNSISSVRYKPADSAPETRDTNDVSLRNTSPTGPSGTPDTPKNPRSTSVAQRRALNLASHSRSSSVALPTVPVPSSGENNEALERKLLSLEREVDQLQSTLRERDEELVELSTQKRGLHPSPRSSQISPSPSPGPGAGQRVEPNMLEGMMRQMAQAEAEHKKQVDALREELDQVRSEHEQALNTLRGDHAAEVQKLRQSHADELLRIEAQHASTTRASILTERRSRQLSQSHPGLPRFDDDASSDLAVPFPLPPIDKEENLDEHLDFTTVEEMRIQSQKERDVLEKEHAAALAQLVQEHEAERTRLVAEVGAVMTDYAALQELNVELVQRANALQEQLGTDPGELALLRGERDEANEALVTLENYVTELSAERDQLTTELGVLREGEASTGGHELLLRELEAQREQVTLIRKDLTAQKAAYNALMDEKARVEHQLADSRLKVKALSRRSCIVDGRFIRGVPPPTLPPSVPVPPVPSTATGSRPGSTTPLERNSGVSSTVRTAGSVQHAAQTSDTSATTILSGETSPDPAMGEASLQRLLSERAAETKALKLKLVNLEADKRANVELVATLEAALNDSERNLRKARVQLGEVARERDQLAVEVKEARARLDDTSADLERVRSSVQQEKHDWESRVQQERLAKERAKEQLAARLDEVAKRKNARLFCM